MVVSILVLAFVITKYAWVQACGVGWNGNPNMQYIFSDFEEINGTGVYVSEVIGMEPSDNGKGDQCRNDKKVRLNEVDIYLFDNQGLRNFTGNLGSLQDNYAGNNSKRVDSSVEIANDNGTEFPIHFENQMDNDFEKYGESAPTWQEVVREDELYLSVGDKIKVYGSGSEANGPAESGWSIRIKWIAWGETIEDDLVIP